MRLRIAKDRSRTRSCPLSSIRVVRSSKCSFVRRGFSLIEIILVLVLIGVAAAILIPSVSGAFSVYHIERAGEDLQMRLARTRLQAMEAGVPYAFSFRPETDQFLTWACEPLNISQGSYGTSGPTASAAAAGDAYDQHYFELNDKDDNKEFRFLSYDVSEPLTTAGLSSESRAGLVDATTAEAIAGSALLARHKLGMTTPSARSSVALQIPGLQLGDVAPPLVFEPAGSIDRDAIIRIADRSGHYIEVSVQALSGAITVSPAKNATDAAAEGVPITTTPTDRAPTAITAPSRSREIRSGGTR